MQVVLEEARDSYKCVLPNLSVSGLSLNLRLKFSFLLDRQDFGVKTEGIDFAFPSSLIALLGNVVKQ